MTSEFSACWHFHGRKIRHSASGNFARYHFELLREIGRGDRLHCDELIADDLLQRPSKHDQWNRISLYDC
jgi:hypothetical protein